MSGNFFGDDDDFELTPGGDDSAPVAPKRPASSERPVQSRPVAPQAGTAGTQPVPPSRSALPRRPRPNTSAQPVSAPPAATTPAPRQSTLPVRTPRAQPTPPMATEAPARVIPAPAPAPEPEPVYTPAPEPVYVPAPEPEPVYTPEPEPVYVPKPEPVYVPEPEPVYTTPPVQQNPAPVQQRATISQTRNARQDSGFANSSSAYDPMDEIINSRRDFKDSFSEPEEEPQEEKQVKGKSNSRNAKNRKASTPKKTPAKKEGPGAFAGARKSVLITRIIAGSVVVLLMGTGVNSMINPRPIPTKPAITKLIRSDLNITKFPTQNGNAFVSAFAKEYLTFTPDQRSNKTDALKMFTTDSLASRLTGSTGPELTQKVLEAPIVSGVRSIDDNNAVYTVGTKVDTGWVYLDIPVYYNPDLNSFSISGTPAFVAPPVKPEEIPSVEAPYSNDTTLVNTIEEDISNFFKVWSESNEDEIKRYINIEEADVETKNGLQKSVVFVEVATLQVEKKEAESPDPGTRRAQAKVTWANPANPKITYDQNYDLILKRGDQDRWYVADITGGVRASGVGT